MRFGAVFGFKIVCNAFKLHRISNFHYRRFASLTDEFFAKNRTVFSCVNLIVLPHKRKNIPFVKKIFKFSLTFSSNRCRITLVNLKICPKARSVARIVFSYRHSFESSKPLHSNSIKLREEEQLSPYFCCLCDGFFVCIFLLTIRQKNRKIKLRKG